jgi:ER degradation enhancer, mannosidase alpha-like 2
MPAFATKTGVPFGTVNLARGVPVGESQYASLAGAGSLTMEFGMLSALTGNDSFAAAAFGYGGCVGG